jgi:flagellar biosynthesis protein FlhF
MKIKKVRARTFSDALAIVRKELGRDAVILSSDDKKENKSYVEITAAIDYDNETYDSSINIHECPKNEENELVKLKNEIVNLRSHVEAMRRSGYELHLAGEKKKMYDFLKERAIKDEYALKVVERAQRIEDIESVIKGDLNIAGEVKGFGTLGTNAFGTRDRKIIMLIGPTGVGKTTTVAKLASMAIREKRKVALISLDTFKIGAAEQIRIYARMIGIPLDVVSSSESFMGSVRRFSDRDIILVDTAGHNPRNREYIDSLKGIYETGLPIETQLLLSISSDCDFMMETHKHYTSIPVNSMTFTKTDEAVNVGTIYNVCCLFQKPVAYITTGQKVPGNIECADRKGLTNLILRTGCA